jgi:hypothetical protein
MKKILLYGLSLFCLSICVSSCMPKDDLVYTGPSVIEFKNHLQGRIATSLPVGVISNGALTRSIRVNTRVTDTIFVQLVGPQLSVASVLPFTVNSTSTAVEGVHYNFNAASPKTVTIPANSSVGYVLVNPVPNSIVGTATFPLVIDLVGTEQIKPSPNYKTFTLTLRN